MVLVGIARWTCALLSRGRPDIALPSGGVFFAGAAAVFAGVAFLAGDTFFAGAAAFFAGAAFFGARAEVPTRATTSSPRAEDVTLTCSTRGDFSASR